MTDDVRGTPAAWLVAHEQLLPPTGDALDVACGSGRHALWLAARDLHVRAIDRDDRVLMALRETARARRLPLDVEARDLELAAVDLGRDRYDLIVCVHYLHRPLFPALLAALRPGGLLVYETFTRAQARRGKPTNPAFLLEPGELRVLTRGLAVVDEREGEFDGRDVASIVCRKEPASASFEAG